MKWDYKNRENTIFGLAWGYDIDKERKFSIDKTIFTKFTYNYINTNFQTQTIVFKNAADFGNFHAGYFGIYLGVPRIIQYRWAGLGELSKGKYMNRIFTENITDTPPYGDTKIDFYWTTFGMNNAKSECDCEMYEKELHFTK